MNRAARKLSRWISDRKIKKGEFAKKIGVGLPTLSRLLNGTRMPSLALADRIYDETGGSITVKDWLASEDEECEAA